MLSRYERDPHGRVIIDVAADRVEDLYSDYDRRAPYVRRDLEADLVEYMIGSAREVGQVEFLIRFTLADIPADESLSRVAHSVQRYFQYLAELERHEIHRMVRRSTVLLAIGLVILFLSVWLNQRLGEERTVVENVFAEGLTVAAWVSLWEALATFILDWFPHRTNVALYRRLASAELAFARRTAPEEG